MLKANPVGVTNFFKLIESLEDHEDVQNVFSDFDIPADVLEQISAE